MALEIPESHLRAPKPSREQTRFDRIAGRLMAAPQIREQSAVSSDDYRVVLKTLTRYAHGFGLSEADAEDVASVAVSEAVTRAFDPNRSGVQSPGAYLFWMTRNRALDARRRARSQDVELFADDSYGTRSALYYSEEDDEISRLLERRASAEMLEDALRAAAAADDRVLVRVVSAWLDLAETSGRTPRSREVAQEADVSHTTVNQTLRRLRSYFAIA